MPLTAPAACRDDFLSELGSTLAKLVVTEECSEAELDSMVGVLREAIESLLQSFDSSDMQSSSSELQEFLFVGRLSLQQHRHALEASVLEQADKRLSAEQVVFALRELVAALRKFVTGAGYSGSFEIEEKTRTARVRRRVGDLYLATFKGGTPSAAQARDRLRRIGSALTYLISNRNKDLLRIDEVRMAREMQARLVQFLRRNEHAEAEALQLWSDAQAMVSLLASMSHRGGLSFADRQMLQNELDLLVARETDTIVVARALRALVPLCGANEALDAIMLSEEQPAELGERLRGVLEGMIEEFEERARTAEDETTGVRRNLPVRHARSSAVEETGADSVDGPELGDFADDWSDL